MLVGFLTQKIYHFFAKWQNSRVGHETAQLSFISLYVSNYSPFSYLLSEFEPWSPSSSLQAT